MSKIKFLLSLPLAAAWLVAGCQSEQPKPAVAATPPITSAVTTPPAAPGAIIRVKAGASSNVTDNEGNVWLSDQGFDGGDTVERPGIDIANTKDPMIYQSEHYGMDSFSWKVPDGNYEVKLHFAETYEGITGPGGRVFSYSVNGQDFKDFDVWKAAGGPLRAYVQDVKVTVTDGQVIIKFTPNVENPQINGIEIIPAS